MQEYSLAYLRKEPQNTAFQLVQRITKKIIVVSSRSLWGNYQKIEQLTIFLGSVS